MYKNLSASALGVTGHQSEIIELALTYGFRGMDFDIVEFAHRAEKKGMPYARRLIDSAKLRLGTFPLPLACDAEDETFRQGLEKLPEYARTAGEVEATRCVVTIAPAGDQRPYHENFEFHRHRLAEVAKVLEPSGVRLGIGFRAAEDLRKGQAFQFIHDLEAATLLAKMTGAPNVGVVLNLWDVHVSGGSVEQVRELSAEQVVAVEVADLPADVAREEATEASRVLPSPEGQIDVAGYVAALSEMGYDGPVTLKPARSALGSRRRDPIVRQAGEALGAVWRDAGLASDGRPAAPASG